MARTQGERDRVIERFKRLGPQQKALEVTLRPFLSEETNRMDSERWSNTFESSDPEAIALVFAVDGAFQTLVNHLMEMLQSAGKLANLEVSRDGKPTGPALVDAVIADGGLSRAQGQELIRLYRTRNALQHDSPDVETDELREAIELLRGALVNFVRSYLKWMDRHGVAILPEN